MKLWTGQKQPGNLCRHHKVAGENKSTHSSLKDAICIPYTRLRQEWDSSCSRSVFFFPLTIKGALVTSSKRGIYRQMPASGPSPSHQHYLPSQIRALITCLLLLTSAFNKDFCLRGSGPSLSFISRGFSFVPLISLKKAWNLHSLACNYDITFALGKSLNFLVVPKERRLCSSKFLLSYLHA